MTDTDKLVEEHYGRVEMWAEVLDESAVRNILRDLIEKVRKATAEKCKAALERSPYIDTDEAHKALDAVLEETP